MKQIFLARTVAAFAAGMMLTSGIPSYAYDDYDDRRAQSYDRYDEEDDTYDRDYRDDNRYERRQPARTPPPAPSSSAPLGMSKSAAGALTGAVLGAGTGAIVGSHKGRAGRGALIGGGVGAVGGYLMGKQIENRDSELDGEEQRLLQQREEIARNRELINDLKRRKLDARETKRGVVVNLPDVLFEYNKASLTRDARDKVGDIAEILEERTRNRRVSVEGHADAVGGQDYNLRLSQNRAESVAQELADSGVRDDRLKIKGFGEKYPVAPNTRPNGADNPSGRAKNRRVEVIIEN